MSYNQCLNPSTSYGRPTPTTGPLSSRDTIPGVEAFGGTTRRVQTQWSTHNNVFREDSSVRMQDDYSRWPVSNGIRQYPESVVRGVETTALGYNLNVHTSPFPFVNTPLCHTGVAESQWSPPVEGVGMLQYGSTFPSQSPLITGGRYQSLGYSENFPPSISLYGRHINQRLREDPCTCKECHAEFRSSNNEYNPTSSHQPQIHATGSSTELEKDAGRYGQISNAHPQRVREGGEVIVTMTFNDSGPSPGWTAAKEDTGNHSQKSLERRRAGDNPQPMRSTQKRDREEDTVEQHHDQSKKRKANTEGERTFEFQRAHTPKRPYKTRGYKYTRNIPAMKVNPQGK